MKELVAKIILKILYFCFILTLKSKNQKINEYFAKRFVDFNNDYIIKNLKIKPKNILILIPHCLQNYECNYRITNDISNCIECGRCVIKYFADTDKNTDFKVKVANGGTIARKFIKEVKPDFIIAVACKRDLISGIIECDKIPVYGIFNIIKNESCINTDVDTQKIKFIVEKLIL